MYLSTLATLAVLAGNALAWSTTSAAATSTYSSESASCYTITEYNKPPCTMPSMCIQEECLTISTITLECGCGYTIPTTDICLSTCPDTGCQVQYKTLYLPCATSFSSPTTTTTSSSTSSTGVIYSNTTVTVTTVTTLTTCPATCTCSGQKTTWSGSSGPYTCTSTPSCVAQLPGGPTTTITGTTVVQKTGPTPTTSAGPTQVSVGAGKKGSEVSNGGLLAGLIGLLALF